MGLLDHRNNVLLLPRRPTCRRLQTIQIGRAIVVGWGYCSNYDENQAVVQAILEQRIASVVAAVAAANRLGCHFLTRGCWNCTRSCQRRCRRHFRNQSSHLRTTTVPTIQLATATLVAFPFLFFSYWNTHTHTHTKRFLKI